MKITNQTTVAELQLELVKRGVRDARVFAMSSGDGEVYLQGVAGAYGSGRSSNLAEAFDRALHELSCDDLGAVSPER